MRQTNLFKPVRQRAPFKYTSKSPRRLDKPHSKMPFVATLDGSQPKPPYCHYSFCNKRIGGTEEHQPSKIIERELGKGVNDANNGHMFWAVDDGGGESLEWYIRLASRCYRDGFQLYADYLRRKGTQVEMRQLTRRPLQLTIQRYLEEQKNKGRSKEVSQGIQWSSHEVASDNPIASRTLQSIPSTNHIESKREFEIRVQISPNDGHNKYRLHHPVESDVKHHHDKTITRSSSQTHKTDLSNSDIFIPISITDSQHMIDDFSALNISSEETSFICDDPLNVIHHKLPQIVLTDCCSNNYDVCQKDDNNDANISSKTQYQ